MYTGASDATACVTPKSYLYIGASDATVLAIAEVLLFSRPALQPLPDIGADGVPGVHVLPLVEQVGPTVVHVLGGPLVSAVLGPLLGLPGQRIVPHLARQRLHTCTSSVRQSGICTQRLEDGKQIMI